MTYYRTEVDDSSEDGGETDDPSDSETSTQESIQCRDKINIEIGGSASLSAMAYGDTKAEMEAVTKGMTWVSENEQIATVYYSGFINCTSPRILTSGDKKKEIWSSSGLVWVEGKGEGTTNIVGTTKAGTTIKCEVTVTKPPVPSDSSKGNGGSFSLGIDNIIEPEKSNDSSKKGVADFFPGSWSLSSFVFNTGKQDTNTTVTLYDSETKQNSLEQKGILVAANGHNTMEFVLKKDSINYNKMMLLT